LEINGVLASWAIPKGPSTNPTHKRMARRTDDHPLDYPRFEGVIPDGQYGAGTVIVADRGTYTNATHHDMAACLDRGHLSFRLQGEKLQGGFTLTRIREGKDETWLLIKRQDEEADTSHNPVNSQPAPVVSGRALDDPSESS
jgi:DNA ligase D-like protein (predicted 3'-phosphoesterase)